MTLVRRYFICAVLRSCETPAELVVCGRAVMRDARMSLFIFAVLSAFLRSGFRDTGKYIGRGSRRNSNKLDRTMERPTIRWNQSSAFNCESVDSLLNSSTTVHVFCRVLSTYRVIIDRLWAVSPYIFANCCFVGRFVVPSFRLVLGKPNVCGIHITSL